MDQGGAYCKLLPFLPPFSAAISGAPTAVVPVSISLRFITVTYPPVPVVVVALARALTSANRTSPVVALSCPGAHAGTIDLNT